MAERNGFCCLISFWQPWIWLQLNDPDDSANRMLEDLNRPNYRHLIVRLLFSAFKVTLIPECRAVSLHGISVSLAVFDCFSKIPKHLHAPRQANDRVAISML